MMIPEPNMFRDTGSANFLTVVKSFHQKLLGHELQSSNNKSSEEIKHNINQHSNNCS